MQVRYQAALRPDSRRLYPKYLAVVSGSEQFDDV